MLEQQRKDQRMTKLQGQIATMTTNVATPSQCKTLILIVVGHQKSARRILDHLARKKLESL
jgi:hypothetical protein